MRIIKFDRKKGIAKIKIEYLTDLWHLLHILEPGDYLTAKTLRRVSIKRGDKIEYGEKKSIIATICLKKMEFQKDTGKLRLSGIIIRAPESFSMGHHTMKIEPGVILTIEKKWKDSQVKRMVSAGRKEPTILVCLIDRENACFFSLKTYEIEFLGENPRPVIIGKGKHEYKQESNKRFYEKVANYMRSKSGYEKIIIAGPGFEKLNLFNFIKNSDKTLADKIVLETVSTTKKSGLNELLKKTSNRILSQIRITRETQRIEKLFEEIGKDGLVVYGKEEVENAIKFGALKELIVSEEKIYEYEKLMEMAESVGCKVEIVSSIHEAGERFLHLGGIGGFLRFRIPSM